MPISIVVPQLGESVADGTDARWLKSQGDRVRKEEPLVEIQTDKINVEIPSPAEGTLSQILVAEGTTVLVGTEIAQLLAPGESAAAGTPAAAVVAAPAGSAPASPAPASSPAAAPRSMPAPASTLTPAPAYASAATPHAGNGETALGETRNLSPAVRKIMREQGVGMDELDTIRGSGIAGRVTRDDLLGYLSQRGARPALAPRLAAAAPAAPMPASAPAAPRAGFLAPQVAPAAGGPREEVVPFSKVRKLIAENMVRAKHTAAHTHCFDEADMSAIVALKKEWGPKLEAQGVKLTYMPFFIKAAVLALREFPWVNGEVRGESMVLKKYYNIGIAVGRDEKGLI
ncbi:MAG TPA: dihydrolipoamide acetyltransferase family protein, partial [Methylomirabilota bacterium]|nr:dihydrolipoamide acetyltransferase family protein [Methylomirabilota bacterium]